MSSRGSQRLGTVCVVGSINLDTVFEVDRLPRPGETLAALAVRHNVGGKGANQAVAAARAGAAATLVARVGADDIGRRMRDEVARFSVDITRVRGAERAASGTAFITVDPTGENTIVIDPGANASWDSFSEDASAIAEASVLVLQHEIPAEVVTAAAEQATGRVVLNAAPARDVPVPTMRRCDPLVVNRSELGLLGGAERIDDPDRIADPGWINAALAGLVRRGARSVVVTLGAEGARWVASKASRDGEGAGTVAARRAQVVDSTGAGDAFVGVLAARLATGASLAEALRWAAAAGSLSVERRGTFEAYPSLAAIEAALAT